MTLPDLLEGVRRRTSMYVVPTSFDCVVNYLSGYNAATNGGLLIGFREWLVVRCGHGHNFVWMAIVERLLDKQGLPSNDEARIVSREPITAHFLSRPWFLQ